MNKRASSSAKLCLSPSYQVNLRPGVSQPIVAQLAVIAAPTLTIY